MSASSHNQDVAAGVEPPPWEHPDGESYPDMNYLLSEAAQSRYILAAHYVRDCPHVVEIGGFKTPITRYLTTTPSSVLVLDPKMPAYRADTLHGQPCRVRHLAARFQDWEFDYQPGTYGLVILGCSMKYFSTEEARREEEWGKLVHLIDRARVAVLEFPVDWRRGADDVQRMLSRAHTRTRLQMDLDMQGSPGMDTVYCKRRFLVLEPSVPSS